MQAPITPQNEDLRLQELCGLGVLDTAFEERFDRVTRSACRMFGVPIALISLVDRDRQWFKSKQGLAAAETPRDISFCGHAILQDFAFVVNDASQDPRFADNPLVTGELNLRFYAGYPLRGPHGFHLGTLCLIDKVPRSFSEDDEKALADLAAWAEVELSSVSLAEAIAMATDKEQRLQQSQKLLSAVMGGTSAYVHMRDIEGRYLYVNPEYERVFQLRHDEIIGKPLEEFLPAEMAANVRSCENQVLATGKAMQSEVVVPQEDGPHTYLVVRSPLVDEDGKIYGTCGVGTDITDEKRSANAVQDLNRQLAATTSLHMAILNGCNFSIISTNQDGMIGTFNRGAEQMLGYSAAEMVGLQSPAILHLPQEIEARAQALSAELGIPVAADFSAFVAKARLGMVDEHEWTYCRKNGTQFPVMLSITALRDADGEISAYLGIAYDLSERKRIESMKNEFISTVSHELRTPLTSIRGSIGLLTAGAVGEIPARAKTLLDIAKTNCERLVRLINDILDIEKIESGNMRFVDSVQPLQPLLETALGTISAYANQFQVRFELNAPEGVIFVNVDPDRLTQVMVNLLSNATKFSPNGAIVTVRVDLQGEMVRVAVIDRGEGIPEEFQARIFRKFAQADSSDARAKGGTGLGLNITKAIIERMQGQIDFTSVPGKGSEFFFLLPVVNLAPLNEQARDRLLICENDGDIAHLLHLMLSQVGIGSDIAHSAKAAREMLLNRHYDGMTLDLGLPDEDGMSFLGWLREHPTLSQLPVVVISANAVEGQKSMQGQAFGVIDWISKPIESERLLLAMEKIAVNHNHLPHVLHVEDDPDLRQVVNTILGEKYQVLQASNLQQARHLLETESFALILLDLELPDGNGADLLASLPQRNRATPVVIFSAQEASREVAERVKAALVKSHTSNEQLLETMRNLIERRSVTKT
ncbi:MAG: response regulator [Burkholderiales bacterium]|nr:response regulator [Burkholderiales bacterium]